MWTPAGRGLAGMQQKKGDDGLAPAATAALIGWSPPSVIFGGGRWVGERGLMDSEACSRGRKLKIVRRIQSRSPSAGRPAVKNHPPRSLRLFTGNCKSLSEGGGRPGAKSSSAGFVPVACNCRREDFFSPFFFFPNLWNLRLVQRYIHVPLPPLRRRQLWKHRIKTNLRRRCKFSVATSVKCHT